MQSNKPDQATMRPGCVSACIDHVTYVWKRQMDEPTDEKTLNMLVDHLFHCRSSLWPKKAEKRGFSTGVMDGPTDRRTDRKIVFETIIQCKQG